MPCMDPRDVTSVEEAFDLTTTDIQQWELELIWSAERLGVLGLSSHARQAARDDSIPKEAIMRVVRDGVPRWKDVLLHATRQVGINFQGKRRGGRLRTKVSWFDEYVVVTVHAL